MLHKETKKRIDDARDILVGQLPLPTDQVEHITLALIYKFMDDQDEELRQLEYDENFFKGDLKKYSWQNIMTNENAADVRVNLFIEGIEAIKKAEHIPALFKEIFGQALWKIRDGRILMLFFNKINEFRYDHSEELGNAFEYILMTLGAQGSNGQFRTPRNIIDFIVEVVDPDKNDSILDPACGTGGFLVSAFKHILRKNTTGQEDFRITFDNQADTEGGVAVNWGDKLTTNERNNIGKNISGYDITPMMARLARTNLYLHNFTNPKIHEYDTLSSETRWKDRFSCILANPPFMTPKGGVSTHDKFKIRATKAEILFSDYIVEHLTLNGKAGFIVPEGVIFTKSGDYTQLRKWITQEAGLWAVVSLPSGVFQPYSGVKTSIVFIDRQIARTRTEILLMKVENDGFSLNVQRNPIKKNDLPKALELLTLCKTDLEAFKALNTEGSSLSYKLLERDDFARLDAYKAHTTAWDFVKKQWKKALTTDNECKASVELIQNDEKLKQTDKDKRLLKIEDKRQKAIVEWTEKTGCIDLWANETDLKTWYNDTLKDAAVAYGVDLIKNEPITEGVVEALDWEREYSWSLERYVEEIKHFTSEFDLVRLSDVVKIQNGFAFKSEFFNDEKIGVPIIRIRDLKHGNSETYYSDSYDSDYLVNKGDILIGMDGEFGAFLWKTNPALLNQRVCRLVNFKNVLPEFIYRLLNSELKKIEAKTFGVTVKHLSHKDIESIEIPLPPLSIQRAIVAEIESYQKVIDGCRMIVDNYKPSFEVGDDWEVVKLGDCTKIFSGGTPSREIPEYWNGDIAWIKTGQINYEPITAAEEFITEEGFKNSSVKMIPKGTILMAMYGQGVTRGRVAILGIDATINQACAAIVIKENIELDRHFLYYCLMLKYEEIRNLSDNRGGNQANLNAQIIRDLEIPLPPLSIQHAIVADLERDRAIVEGAKALAAKMEGKIKGVIDKVWGKGIEKMELH